jgi:carbohydrate-selective porin OprB
MKIKIRVLILFFVFMLANVKQHIVFANNNNNLYTLSREITLSFFDNKPFNSVDIKFLKLLTSSSKIVLCIEGNSEICINKMFKDEKIYKSLDFQLKLKLSKLFYETILLNNKFTVTLGKIGFFSYFAQNTYAGDSKKQFVTAIFSKDQLIDIPQEPCALRINYVLSKKFNVDYAYYMSMPTNHINLHDLNALQITYCDSTTNCRLYSWLSSHSHSKNNEYHKLYGGGLSLDKKISKTFGLFYRYCYKNNSYFNNQQLPLSFLWSIGSQVTGPIHHRTKDTLGVAIGKVYKNLLFLDHQQVYISKRLLNKFSIPMNQQTKTQIELYYNFQLNNRINISPIIQYFITSVDINTQKLSSCIYGIRTNIKF